MLLVYKWPARGRQLVKVTFVTNPVLPGDLLNSGCSCRWIGTGSAIIIFLLCGMVAEVLRRPSDNPIIMKGL
jgi:hypothetical protein